jgi:hypothetical protein
MSFDPSSFLPMGAQFGGNMTAMVKGFEQRQQGQDYKAQMGGMAGIAGGATGLVGSVTSAIPQIQQGKAAKQAGLKHTGRQMQAQAGLNMAASAASMGGPIGAAVAAPLMLISALMNIQGPRKRRERRAAEQRAKVQAKTSSMRANAAGAGMQLAGGIMRTGASIGPQPTVADPTAPVHSFTPQVSNNGR